MKFHVLSSVVFVALMNVTATSGQEHSSWNGKFFVLLYDKRRLHNDGRR